MTYKGQGISSIAFPLLGASNGRLNPRESLALLERYLDGLDDIRVEVYEYDPALYLPDPFFMRFLSYLEENYDNAKLAQLHNHITHHPEIKCFSDIVQAKQMVDLADGSKRQKSVATKKALQRIVVDMDKKGDLPQQQRLFETE